MNVRMLKAKRVERNLRQKDLANALGITEKAMCPKVCSEFDAIFFNHELTKRLRIIAQKQTSGKQQ